MYASSPPASASNSSSHFLMMGEPTTTRPRQSSLYSQGSGGSYQLPPTSSLSSSFSLAVNGIDIAATSTGGSGAVPPPATTLLHKPPSSNPQSPRSDAGYRTPTTTSGGLPQHAGPVTSSPHLGPNGIPHNTSSSQYLYVTREAASIQTTPVHHYRQASNGGNSSFGNASFSPSSMTPRFGSSPGRDHHQHHHHQQQQLYGSGPHSDFGHGSGSSGPPSTTVPQAAGSGYDDGDFDRSKWSSAAPRPRQLVSELDLPASTAMWGNPQSYVQKDEHGNVIHGAGVRKKEDNGPSTQHSDNQHHQLDREVHLPPNGSGRSPPAASTSSASPPSPQQLAAAAAAATTTSVQDEPHRPLDPLERRSFIQQIELLYQAKAPEKLVNIETILKKYEGCEDVLLEVLMEKYEVSRHEMDSLWGVAQQQTTAAENASDNKNDPEGAALRRRVERMYERYCPAKLGNVTSVLKKYEGDEDLLLEVLVKKYGPEPPL